MGSSRFARRYSGNRIFFLFLQVLRCFSSLGLSLTRYEFTRKYYAIKRSGFPHSEIPGSKLTYSSPRHIGVSAVLHRLLVPRHPPCALNNLTNKLLLTRRVRLKFTRQLLDLFDSYLLKIEICVCFQCRFIQFSKNKATDFNHFVINISEFATCSFATKAQRQEQCFERYVKRFPLF